MFIKKIDSRIKMVLTFFIILFIILILKVFYIQVFEYKKLYKKSQDLWSRDLVVEADRGLILDRNGIVLADNLTTTSLILIPNQIKDGDLVSEKLAEILNVSKEEMTKHVNKNTSIERVHPEGRRLSYEVANKIAELNLPGVYLIKESKRNYPYNEMLSHVLGYVGIDNQGLAGIELEYNKYLQGENGAIKYFSDAKGNQLNLSDIYLKPQSGMNIQLTIDFNIQKSIEREMNNIIKMFNPDMALAIVMDPNNGEILGMSSRPSYNPNNYKDYSSEILNRNLPVWATYEPGSTFKIMTFSASVEENLIKPEEDHFFDSGSVHIGGARIGCWKSGGHGDQTFLQVLENSCNPGFVKLGQMLGKDRLFSYLDKFGFGKKTGIDLNGEGSGIIFPIDKVGELELVTTAFGQGVSVTPIQQVTAVSSVVNGGELLEPYIVKRITDPISNSTLLENNRKFVRNTISKDTSMKMRYYLESVVARGGGRSAYIDGYRIGGKTGTAQKVQDGHYLVNNYIMSFMAVVPANDPKAIVYLAIDNPKKTALLSSYTTTPIARRIILDTISALNIPKQENQIEKIWEWSDKEYIEVPNVINMNLKDAKVLLKDFQIEYSGSGNRIIEQTPNNPERIPKGDKVRILLGE